MADNDSDTRSPSRWSVVVASVRALLTAAVLVALYYLLPLDNSGSDTSVIVKLDPRRRLVRRPDALATAGHRAVEQSRTARARRALPRDPALPPAVRRGVLPDEPGRRRRTSPRRSRAPTRLYFTVTIFSTVGFGDISAKAEAARLVVTAQMFLDLDHPGSRRAHHPQRRATRPGAAHHRHRRRLPRHRDPRMVHIA